MVGVFNVVFLCWTDSPCECSKRSMAIYKVPRAYVSSEDVTAGAILF